MWSPECLEPPTWSPQCQCGLQRRCRDADDVEQITQFKCLRYGFQSNLSISRIRKVQNPVREESHEVPPATVEVVCEMSCGCISVLRSHYGF